jgi:hypothetical protein
MEGVMMRPLSAIGIVVFLASFPSNSLPQAPVGSTSPTTFHVLEATIDDVQSAFKSRQLTCRSLLESYLNRINAYDKVGPSLNAVQTINPHALVEADRLDATFKSSGPVGAPCTVFQFS